MFHILGIACSMRHCVTRKEIMLLVGQPMRKFGKKSTPGPWDLVIYSKIGGYSYHENWESHDQNAITKILECAVNVWKDKVPNDIGCSLDHQYVSAIINDEGGLKQMSLIYLYFWHSSKNTLECDSFVTTLKKRVSRLLIECRFPRWSIWENFMFFEQCMVTARWLLYLG